MDKKLLIFLHGFWRDKTDYHEEMIVLSTSLWLHDYVTWDAPFPSGRERGGLAWFDLENVTRKAILDDGKFDFSIKYIHEKIESELVKRKLSWDDVILCGRSQWAFMAIYLWLFSSAKCSVVISLCWMFYKDFTKDILQKPHIIRLEAANDTVLSHEKKSSYQDLEKEGVVIEYIKDATSEHDVISLAAVHKVADAAKQYLK